MQRVLFVDHVDRILGGAEVNLIELMGAAQAASAWEMSCACRAGSELGQAMERLGIPQFDNGFPEGLNTLRLAGRRFPWSSAWAAWRALRAQTERLRGAIRAAGAEVVVSCTNKDHFVAARACRGSDARSVWWVNDLLTKDFFPAPARAAFRKYAGQAHRLVAVSNCVRGALASLLLPQRRLATVHNGIPLENYQRTEGGALRGPLGIPAGAALFGFAGRLTPWKGARLFLEIAEAWIGAGGAGHFVVIGAAFNEDQAHEKELREFVAGRNLGGRVHFVGFQRKMAAALSDLDGLLHTSLKPEPFGRVIIEAMAVGTPVVAAEAGGAREIISPGRDGWLARPGDVGEYVERLGRIWPMSPATAAMTSAGQARVRDQFNLGRVLREFQNALGGPG